MGGPSWCFMKTFRLLLPGRMRDGSLLSWTSIGELSGYPSEVDGYTDWTNLTELRPGREGSNLPTVAAGTIDSDTSKRLADGFGQLARTPWTWDPRAIWDSQSSRSMPSHVKDMKRGTLNELLTIWRSSRFSGLAETTGATLEAPLFTDSLLVSVDESFVDGLSHAGLELWAHARISSVWA